MTMSELRDEKIITISHTAFWRILGAAVGVLLLLMLTIAVVAAYSYGERVKRQCYTDNRREFIETFKVVQYELSNQTYCYEPRGGLVLPAKYKGKNLYQVTQ